MSLLIFTFRHHEIISLKAKYNLALMNLRRKLENLQDYTYRIADGVTSYDDLANTSLFSRMIGFAGYAHQFATAGASRNFEMMKMSNPNIFTQLNANQQKQYSEYLWTSLYNQERQKAADNEAKLLHKEETKINNEIADIETKLKMIDAEEDKVKSAEDKAAKDTAPSYVA